MKVSELGEFGLIDLLAKMVEASRNKQQTSWQQLIVGMGDDAAAWQGDASLQLATTDSLIQDVHFSLDITPWHELGWKALAVNLSDIAAMGGVPIYALVSLALPGDVNVDDVVVMYQGMLELAEQHGVALIGGDTCRAPLVSINVTVLGGMGDKRKGVLRRNAAEAGDKVAVTGYPGGAAAGMEMLTKKLHFDAEAAAYLRKAFLQPVPRIAEGQLLLKHGVKAAIDISDGLVADLAHICQASCVSARVEINKLPIHRAVADNFGARALELALTGGEDYELLFTAREDVVDEVRRDAACPVTVIGEIEGGGEAGKVNLIDIKGEPFLVSKAGWEHFRAE
jgi:thiamine-monophosphate kinase